MTEIENPFDEWPNEDDAVEWLEERKFKVDFDSMRRILCELRDEWYKKWEPRINEWREEYEKELTIRSNLINKHYNKRIEAEDYLKAVKKWYEKWFSQYKGETSVWLFINEIKEILKKLEGGEAS